MGRRSIPKDEAIDRRNQLALDLLRQKPLDYVYCLQENCPHAEECLHKQYFEEMKDNLVIRVFNPKLMAETLEPCPHLITAGSTRKIAIGFTRQVDRMGEAVFKAFQSACKEAFSKTVYYNMRAGRRLLTPGEQRIIIQCAAKAGWTFPEDGFDEMYQVPDWGN